ncbi:FtsK/SpoIIIE domain-containing protein [Isoptericola croceus]|uniref:FtsK/SpoIIIE domain-containing protein n=1 Tax=Isoptericola croceus TaxID=3031406 RepID=UPI0023F74CD5|nr:FtsK/SpoIIIE domain-containing protein [Isoptericola croceus]
MPVRLTLHPEEDVELPDGARLGDLRTPLAELARRPELWHAALEADGTPVGDDAVVGRRPLLPGATLRVVRAAAPGRTASSRAASDVAALRSPWLISPVTGPGAGETIPLAAGGPVAVGHPARSATVRVDSRDRVHVRPGPRRCRPGGPAGLPGRSVGALVRTSDGRERRRRLRLLPRRWRPDTVLEVDGTRYALHRSGDVAAWLAPEPPERATTPPLSPAMLLTGLVPVLGSVALAVTLRQPLYALFSLVAVVALAPQVVAAVRRRRRAQDAAPPPEMSPAGTAPGRTGARVAAAHQASDVAWRRALDTLGARARTGAHRDAAPAGRAPADLLPDGALAVRGPAGLARATARAVVVDLAAAGATVDVVGTGHGAWAWCRWLAPATAPTTAEAATARVLVVDAPDQAARAVADEAARRGHLVVLCLPHEPGGPEVAAPSWCRATVRLAPDGLAHRTAPDGTDTTGPCVGVTTAWAERTARRLAGLRGLRRSLAELDAAVLATTTEPPSSDADGADVTDPGLPAVVPLADLLDGTDPAERWATATGWQVPLGRDAAGTPVTLDLVADGPHLLVAGTTGSGKSELLQSLVLGLALSRSPADLALALVDFKGGASFGRCADLPHVVGQVTDLEPGLAGRALAGLRAELHRRERVLAERRAASLDDAPPGTLPRLVVVIDEFRALADDLPDFLPGLLRIAAQGRSLGVHLVLATQRPSGAVSTDVRANVSARIALRVVDAADSHDVVDTAVAARIPVGAPGRAVLRVGAAPPVSLQCAHAGTLPDDGGPVVRRAPAWRRSAPTGAGGDAVVPRPAVLGRGPVDAAVDDARAAADRLGHRPGPAPWLPALPTRVAEAELPADVPTSGDGPGALPLALADDPAGQRRVLVRWQPRTGHLAVLGPTRSGRTTALVSLAAAALARGWHVHVLAPPAAAPAFADLADHPGLGTVAGPGDPRRARRLLRLLDRAPSPEAEVPRTLVVVDGVEELRTALAGPGAWDPLVTALAAGHAAFALTADAASVGGVAARVGPRLVLLGADQHADVMLGAPSALAGSGGPPGRAAWLPTGEPRVCQVLLPGVPTSAAGGAVPGPGVPPDRVRPLPARVTWQDLADAPDVPRDPGQVVVGVGGDGAVPVALDVGGGALVVGPRGAGRTTVLRTVVRALAATGQLAAVVSRDAALRAEAGDHPATPSTPAAVRRLVEELSSRTRGSGGAGGRAQPAHVVVDDLDALAQSCPVEVERLGTLVEEHGLVLLASATTQGALMAHRGPLAELRALRTGVVLAPGGREADEVFGTPLGDVADLGPTRPGRGALVTGGRPVPLQSAGGVLQDRARHEPEEDAHRQQEEDQPTEDCRR